MPTYRFRAVTIQDLPLVGAWTREAHVAEWWDGEPFAAEDLDDLRVAMRIVEADGTPFAYLQDYDVHGWDGHHFGHLPPGSRGLDQFIGEHAMVGRGHGSAFLAQRMDELFDAGAPVLAVDPHPENARAIAAFRKVGFRVAGEPRETEWGVVLPMEARR